MLRYSRSPFGEELGKSSHKKQNEEFFHNRSAQDFNSQPLESRNEIDWVLAEGQSLMPIEVFPMAIHKHKIFRGKLNSETIKATILKE